MPSLSDEVTSKSINNGGKAAKATLEASGKAAKKALKAGETLIKGLCLVILDGGAFTSESVMKAVKDAAFRKNGGVRYSKNSIDIGTLQKSGHIHKLDESVAADAMKYFDEQCQKYDVKYSAMRDDSNPGKPAYMVFFEGKDTDMIMHVMQEAYKAYMKDAEKGRKAPGKSKGKTSQKRGKESVRAKLAFFGIGLQLGTGNAM